MTEQNNAAAERSAHVERGAGRRIPGESFLVEVSPGIFKLKAVVEVERERDEARARAERAEAERDKWKAARDAAEVQYQDAIAQVVEELSARMSAEAKRDAALADARDFERQSEIAYAERDAARAEATRLREALIAAEKVMRRVQDWGNARDTERADLAYQQVNTALAAKEPGHD